MKISWYYNPWRLFTLFVGISTLLFGAAIDYAPDWDTGASLIMAFTTYVLMPVFDKAARGRNPLYAFLIGDFAANGVYTLYWGWVNPEALFMIWGNYLASWTLFLACWVVWSLVPEFISTKRLRKPLP